MFSSRSTTAQKKRGIVKPERSLRFDGPSMIRGVHTIQVDQLRTRSQHQVNLPQMLLVDANYIEKCLHMKTFPRTARGHRNSYAPEHARQDYIAPPWILGLCLRPLSRARYQAPALGEVDYPSSRPRKSHHRWPPSIFPANPLQHRKCTTRQKSPRRPR